MNQQLMMPDQEPEQTQSPGLMTLDLVSGTLVQFALISPTMREFGDMSVERGLSMVIDSPESELEAGMNLNNIAKAIGQIDDAVKAARQPLKLAADRISDEGRNEKAMLLRAQEEQQNKIAAWREEQRLVREAAILAEHRRQEQERKDREAAAAAAKRKLEEQRQAAEAQKREAERLQWEAQERERLAAQPLMDGNALEAEEVTRVSAGLATAAESDAAAAKAQFEAEEQDRLLKEAEAEAAERQAQAVPSTPVTIIPDAPVSKMKGAKIDLVPTIHKVDLALLPLAYHVYDEKMIKKHLVDGINIPGVSFTIAEVIKATKR